MEYKLLMSITRPLEESSIGLELELQPVSEELRVPIDSSGGQQDAPAPMSGEVVGSLQDVRIPPDPDPMGPLHSTEVSESITDMNDPASVDQVLSELLTSPKNNVGAGVDATLESDTKLESVLHAGNNASPQLSTPSPNSSTKSITKQYSGDLILSHSMSNIHCIRQSSIEYLDLTSNKTLTWKAGGVVCSSATQATEFSGEMPAVSTVNNRYSTGSGSGSRNNSHTNMIPGTSYPRLRAGTDAVPINMNNQLHQKNLLMKSQFVTSNTVPTTPHGPPVVSAPVNNNKHFSTPNSPKGKVKLWEDSRHEHLGEIVYHPTTPWEMLLREKEVLLACGLISKRNKVGMIKHRQLLLTDRRLFYVDPKTMQLRGEIEWTLEDPPVVMEVSVMLIFYL